MNKELASNNNDMSTKPKMLVVDDQPVNIRIIRELFCNDFNIYFANDGNEAIEQFQNHAPEIVLLDIMMPGLNGFEVCNKIKTNPGLDNALVIFITAHYDEGEEIKGFQLGAADFIRKPINPELTRFRVYHHWQKRCQAQALKLAARLDEVTQTANLAKFEETYKLHWFQCAREQVELSLIQVHIDRFWAYRERYGQPAGDECLRQVARVLKQSLNRPFDLVARYNETDFICLLPRTNLDGAAQKAAHIQKQVRGLNIENQSSSQGIVTVSAGIASTVPNRDSPLQLLLDKTEEQLTLAKQPDGDRFGAIMVDCLETAS